jgi:UDP-N-acetylglucosamine--N-acetylmuramyl-(pentapeptide) pyrophosphoryl-undecaprenol N-acetylglucosamine transferase
MNQFTIIVTGVHHTPAIELFRLLKSDPVATWKIIYLTHATSTDTHLANTISQANITYFSLITSKFDRRSLWLSLIKAPLNVVGFIQSLIIIARAHPKVVVSFGGYASFSVVLAAWISRLSIIVHEQTLTPSLALRLSSHFATRIALSIKSPQLTRALPNSKIVLTGNLLRNEIYSHKSSTFSHLSTKMAITPLIYVTGGSQGSKFINDLVWSSLPQLKKYLIIHQTGRHTPPPSTKIFPNYISTPYIGLNDIGWVLNHSTLVVTRAGANTCQELAALKKPAIIIPHPYTQQNEQVLNALWLKRLNPSRITILYQTPKLTPDKFIKTLRKIKLPQVLDTLFSHPTQATHPFVKLIHEVV